MENILNRSIIDTYKGSKRVSKTVRVTKDTALKLDKFLDYCKEVEGRSVSQSQLLAGIITYFVDLYESKVLLDPGIANQMVLELIKKQS